jgi:hypothetical protein
MKALAVVPLFLAIAVAMQAPDPTPAARMNRRMAPPAAGSDEAALVKRGCVANNCARAVTGTFAGKEPSLTSRRSDCSSFQITTVYTDEFFGTVASSSVPTNVPTYASACSTGSPQSAYASACSCWGITATATTSTASFNPSCTNPASNTECSGYLNGFGPVPGNFHLVSCPSQVAFPDNIPGCGCVTDTEGRPFCDRGYAGFFYKQCTSSADCAADERCLINACSGSSCEKAAPGQYCDSYPAIPT